MEMPAQKPRANLYWEHKAVDVKGHLSNLGPGSKVHVTIQGTVTGYSHSDYGCSLELEIAGLEVDPQSRHKGEQVGHTVTESTGEKKAEEEYGAGGMKGEGKAETSLVSLVNKHRAKATRRTA